MSLDDAAAGVPVSKLLPAASLPLVECDGLGVGGWLQLSESETAAADNSGRAGMDAGIAPSEASVPVAAAGAEDAAAVGTERNARKNNYGDTCRPALRAPGQLLLNY